MFKTIRKNQSQKQNLKKYKLINFLSTTNPQPK